MPPLSAFHLLKTTQKHALEKCCCQVRDKYSALNSQEPFSGFLAQFTLFFDDGINMLNTL